MSLLWRKRLFFILLPVLISVAIFSTEFKTDISAFFIAGDNAEEILLASEMQSGTLSRRYILSIGSEQHNRVPNDFVNALIEKFKGIEGVADVWKPGQQRVAGDAILSLYLPHSVQLYSLRPETDLENIFSGQGLNHQAAGLKKALLSPQGAMVKKIALQDPLLLSLNGFRSLAGQIKEVMQRDESYQNLILETTVAGLDYSHQVLIQNQIKTIFADQNKTLESQFQLQMTGVPVFAVVTQTLIEGDIKKVSVLCCIALTLLFLWIFRSFRALFQVSSLLLAVVAVSVLVTHLIFGYIHGMTMAIGTTLIGICIDFPIHALVHAHTVPIEQRIPVVVKIWPSMLMGGATTLVGYMALGLSGYPGFQQIAVYAGTGIMVSLLITRYILPALMSTGKSGEIRMTFVMSWARFCGRFRPLLLTGLVVLLGGSLVGLNSLHWLDDLEQLTPELEQMQANDKQIRSRMISSVEPGRFILVTGKDTEIALQKAEQVYAVLDQLKGQDELKDYFGLYPWLLSKQQQHLNEKLLRGYLEQDRTKEWQAALSKEGLSVERLGTLNYPVTETLTLETVMNSPVRRLIDNQIIVGKDQTLILIWLAEHQPEALQAAFESIDQVRYFSQRDMVNRMAAEYRDRAQKMLIVGLSVIVLLLFIRYKSLLITMQTLLPAVLAALFILAGWSLSGEGISFLHLVGFLLAVAICVDYGIFYRENRSGKINLTYQAMAASMLTSAVAFGSLAVAHTSSLRTLAGVVALGVILGFLFCPIIIRKPENNS